MELFGNTDCFAEIQLIKRFPFPKRRGYAVEK